MQAADKVKPGVWICKEQWMKQYGLSTELPQGVQLPAGEPASEQCMRSCVQERGW
jgi:hypothetical protein